MRLLAIAVFVLSVFAPSGFAAEADRLEAGGGYSVRAGSGWEVSADTLRQVVTLEDGAFPGAALVLSAPNPVLNARQLIALRLAALSKEGVAAEIIAASADAKDGAERIVAHFAAPLNEKEALVGVWHVLGAGGCAIMMEASAPDNAFDAFAAKAEGVMESAVINNAAVEENRGFYAAIAEQLREEAVRRLAPSDAERKALLESLERF